MYSAVIKKKKRMGMDEEKMPKEKFEISEEKEKYMPMKGQKVLEIEKEDSEHAMESLKPREDKMKKHSKEIALEVALLLGQSKKKKK